MKIFYKILKLQSKYDFQTAKSKGTYIHKNVGQIMVLNLHLSSNDVLYLYPVFVTISQKVPELLSRHNYHTKICKGA